MARSDTGIGWGPPSLYFTAKVAVAQEVEQDVRSVESIQPHKKSTV